MNFRWCRLPMASLCWGERRRSSSGIIRLFQISAILLINHGCDTSLTVISTASGARSALALRRVVWTQLIRRFSLQHVTSHVCSIECSTYQIFFKWGHCQCLTSSSFRHESTSDSSKKCSNHPYSDQAVHDSKKTWSHDMWCLCKRYNT